MFDLKALEKAKFEQKEGSIRLDALSAFFAEGEDSIFKVRGLTHSEYCHARSAQEMDEKTEKLIRAMAGDSSALEEATEALIGATKGLHESTRIKIEFITAASIEPKLSKIAARKIADHFPNEFEALANKVLVLSDQPAVVAKKKP